MNKMEATLRWARKLHAVFLVTIPLYVFATILLHFQEQPISPLVFAAIALASLWDIALAMLFRSRKITPAVEVLKKNPDDDEALALWRGGVVLSFAFCETLVLFGLLLKFLGASWNVAGIFYAVGLLLMLAWTPRLDVSSA
jgi:hypothetical protein